MYAPEIIPQEVVEQLLQPVGVRELFALDDGLGLSGARIWKCIGAAGETCLRRWPEGAMTDHRLLEIHRCMQAAVVAQCPFVPRLFMASHGKSYVKVGTDFWEMSQWMPGRANYREEPSVTKLVSASIALAQLHLAWRDLNPLSVATGFVREVVAPAVRDRVVRLQKLDDRVCASLQREVKRYEHANWYCDAVQILAAIPILRPLLLQELAEAAKTAVRCQYILRDVWYDHVLFVEQGCSGLIDYGALRIDTVATDLCRMLGSLTGAGPGELWLPAIEAYRKIVPLTDEELGLFKPLYRSSALLSGAQWLDWLAVEDRDFPGKSEFISQRLRELAVAVRGMVENPHGGSLRFLVP
jgi:Ser/Thr protein kinase RdoA (MazF antagonist)